jgi:hypothetical protein
MALVQQGRFREASVIGDAMKITTSVLADARVLWDFHRIGAPYGRADVVLGLGSYDLSVAEHAARLFLEGLAPWLMFTGGLVPRTDLLQTPWDRAEAKVFGDSSAIEVSSDTAHQL